VALYFDKVTSEIKLQREQDFRNIRILTESFLKCNTSGKHKAAVGLAPEIFQTEQTEIRQGRKE
jgi:hypothetical protein